MAGTEEQERLVREQQERDRGARSTLERSQQATASADTAAKEQKARDQAEANLGKWWGRTGVTPAGLEAVASGLEAQAASLRAWAKGEGPSAGLSEPTRLEAERLRKERLSGPEGPGQAGFGQPGQPGRPASPGAPAPQPVSPRDVGQDRVAQQHEAEAKRAAEVERGRRG